MDSEPDESFDMDASCLVDLLVPEVNLDIEMKELDLPENNNTWALDTLSYFLPIIPLKKLSQEDIKIIKQDLDGKVLECPVTLPTIPLLRLTQKKIKYIQMRLKSSKLPKICKKPTEKVIKPSTNESTRSKKPRYCQKCNVVGGKFHEQFHESVICSTSFECPVCAENFDEMQFFKFNDHFYDHLKVDETMFSASCPVCPFFGKSALEVLQHVLDEHTPKDLEMKCYHCDYSNSSLLEVHDHLKLRHNFGLSVCPICCKWVRKRIEHARRIHKVGVGVPRKMLEDIKPCKSENKYPIVENKKRKTNRDREQESTSIPNVPFDFQHFLDFEEPEHDKENSGRRAKKLVINGASH